MLVCLFVTDIMSIQQNRKKPVDKDRNDDDDDNDDYTITVTGKAQKYIDAELITISVSLTSINNDAVAALRANTENSNSTSDALAQVGVPKRNITTTSFSIDAQYTYPYNETTRTSDKVFKGYQVKNSLQITLSDLELVGKAIDAAINNGANEINSVNFVVPQDRQTELRKSLLKDASDNAKDQAQLVADALGLKIKGVKTIDILSNDLIRPNPTYYSASNAKSLDSSSSAPTIFGSNGSSVSVSVKAIFIIGKK